MEFQVVNRINTSPNVVYIGRGSTFGNPFPMKAKTPNERQRVIKEFKRYLWQRHKDPEDYEWSQAVKLLLAKGEQYDVVYLSCFCKPLDCHGDIIVNYLNWLN